MSCNSCSKRWHTIKAMASKIFCGHKCNFVQVGVRADKNYVCSPLMKCKICGKDERNQTQE